MPPKRKHTEPEDRDDANQTITYACEVDWLACLTDPSSDVEGGEEVANEKTNPFHIIEACKLTYILYHDIQEQSGLDKILQSLNKSGTENDVDLTRAAKSKQSAWKGHVVNKFLLPHVKEIVRIWCVARPYASFKTLSLDERVKLWSEAYDSDPKDIVNEMWKPLIGVLDLKSIFRTNLLAEDSAKMKAVQHMLRQKYLFGCESTYRHSVAETKKVSNFWSRLQRIASNYLLRCFGITLTYSPGEDFGGLGIVRQIQRLLL